MLALLLSVIVSADSLWHFQNGAPAAAQEFAVTGTVINVCRGLFVLEDGGGVTTIGGVPDAEMPAVGDRIAAGGSVAVEFLSCAAPNVPRFEGVRFAKLGRETVPEPLQVTFAELEAGSFDLRRIRTRAIVTERIDDEGDPDRSSLVLRSSGRFQTAVIGRSQLKSLGNVTGSEVEFTGMLLRQTFGGGTFLNTVILITASDEIRVVARPTWWTPTRLLVAFGLVLLGFLVVIVRNHLAKRELGVKIGERTRFAVELHDSLSQNLEGLACQMAATKDVIAENPSAAAQFLGTAERMLDSCRTELKRCLFDLRGDALEEPDFEKAIRKTLRTVLAGDAAVKVDFGIDRGELGDYAAHSVLCMVRELVSNAVRHGKAKTVAVRGRITAGRVEFSVADEGCGFEAGARPGPENGHFGLAGIGDRVRHFGGKLEIDSRKGGPTEVRIVFPLGRKEDHG